MITHSKLIFFFGDMCLYLGCFLKNWSASGFRGELFFMESILMQTKKLLSVFQYHLLSKK